MTIRSCLKGAAAPIALSIALAAQPAVAQDDAAIDNNSGASSTANDTGAGDANAIVVTGSRIASVTPYNSSDPISIVSPAIAKKEGKLDLAQTLQSSPIAAGSTQITSALSSNFVTNGGPGSQTIDLRGLGPNRTLVLLNGRRAGPAGTRGGVSSFDLNVLPLSMISDIQILKTGASSIYGSDAIAGVVNIITKKDTDGIALDANVSLPFDKGGETYRFSATWGKDWGTGHFMISGDYSHTNELARGQRAYLACPEANIYDQSGNRSDLIDPRTGKPHCEDLRWGQVWTYNLINNLQLDGPGGPNTGIDAGYDGNTVLMQYQYPGETLGIPAFGAPSYPGDFGAPAGWYPTGYDAPSTAVQNAFDPFVNEQTIIPKTDLYTVYAEGAVQLDDSVELFGEFLFNRRQTYVNGWRQFWNFGYTGDLYGTCGGCNANNFWGGGWTGVNFLSPTSITNHADSSQQVDYFRGVGGFRGNIGKNDNWHYEVYAQYSRSIGKYRNEQILQDAYNSGNFQTSSCVGTTLPISGKQCIDIPWADPDFLAGKLTPEQVAFLFDWEEGKTVYTQLTGEATVTGNLIDLPAGPLGIALGISSRKDSIDDLPGAITLAGNAWGSSSGGNTAGWTVTSEAYGEVKVPIFADKPFAKDLSLSGAARVTNVTATRKSDLFSSSDKGNWTYKMGFNWTVNDWLRFRGSYGTSYRAPALFEQFLANETSFPTQNKIDPCVRWGANLSAGAISQRTADNCAADGIPSDYSGGGVTATAISSGGVGVLKAETSKAKVFGVVLTPKFGFMPGTQFSLAVDYFDINVNGEISQLGAENIVKGCYDSADFANEPLCDLFNRGQNSSAIYQIDEIHDQYINIASQQNQGIDVSFQAKQGLGKWGSLSLTAEMTWQLKDNIRLLPTSPLTSTNGQAGSPKWVGDFRATWDMPAGFSLFYGLEVIGGTSNVQEFLDDHGGSACLRSYNSNDTTDTSDDIPIYGTYCPDLTAPAVFYHNVSVTKDFGNGRFSITAGVNNLFDQHPPRVSVLNGDEISMIGPVIAASQYGFEGRRVFVNVSANF